MKHTAPIPTWVQGFGLDRQLVEEGMEQSAQSSSSEALQGSRPADKDPKFLIKM